MFHQKSFQNSRYRQKLQLVTNFHVQTMIDIPFSEIPEIAWDRSSLSTCSDLFPLVDCSYSITTNPDFDTHSELGYKHNKVLYAYSGIRNWWFFENISILRRKSKISVLKLFSSIDCLLELVLKIKISFLNPFFNPRLTIFFF